MNILLENDILFALETNSKSIDSLNDNEYVILFKVVSNVLQYITDLNYKTLISRFDKDSYIDPNDIPFILNSNMVLMFKTISTLEGVCKTLNPNFSYYDLVMDLVSDLFSADVIFNRVLNDIGLLIENRGIVNNNNSISNEKLNNAQISQLKKNINRNNTALITLSTISFIAMYFLVI